MRVVLVGGTGFIGRHTVGALREAGHGVLLVSRGVRTAPDGVEAARGDAVIGELPLQLMRGSDALINLIGIRREEGAQTFARAHVEAVQHLLNAARELGIRRFIHVSVVSCRPGPGHAYLDSKWRGEELVRGSGLDFTILKPGLVYGSGDEVLTQLVRLVRFSPIFPLPGNGGGILQPVDVRDVALGIVRSLAEKAAVGQSYDIVGPERMPFREMVHRVAAGLSLGIRTLKTPASLARAGVVVMERLFRSPPVTVSQVRMLQEGLFGDAGPARGQLGLHPRPLTRHAIRELAAEITPLLPFNLRGRRARGERPGGDAAGGDE
jgi:NADH dehydrogenase